MKILHTADWQFGKTSIPKSLQRQENALLELCDFAVKEDINEVLVVGDIFQRHTPTQREKDTLLSILFEFERSGINLRIIPGNHDYEAVSGYLSLRTFLVLKNGKFFSNIHVYDTPGVHIIDNKYVLITFDEKTPKVPKIDIMEELPVIVAYHGLVKGATLENDFKLTTGVDTRTLLAASPIIDYIALGDIHLQQRMSGSVPIYYSGALLQHTFGEKSAGFIELSFGDAFSAHYHEITTVPRLQTVEVEMSDLSVLDSIDPSFITKVRFHGTVEEKKSLKLPELKQQLLDRGCVDIIWDFKLTSATKSVRRSKQVSTTSSLKSDFEVYLNSLPSLQLDRDKLTSMFLEVVEEVTHG